ncbi:MAG: ABC transporter ATP-binding protein [Armatimonadota bacterium]|nr:ABC transporter ATP-binding protein [Armatimonadota bacterium]
MTKAAVELSSVTKSFKLCHGRNNSLKSLALSFRRPRCEELVALDNVSFSIDPGQTTAVIGRNGSGKSTLLRLLGNVFKPTRGKIVVRGRVSALLELGAGLHPDLTGLENIYLNGAILGLRTREIRRRLDDILEFSELGKFVDTPLRSYSNGMVMRLGFSVAVQVDPDVLLIDEVIAVGDEPFQEKCYEKIGEFQKAGKTIIFVSHDLQAVQKVASRAIWLSGGRVMVDGMVEDAVWAYMASIPREG